MACDMALTAVQVVTREGTGRKEIDIKRYAKVEKVCVWGRERVGGNDMITVMVCGCGCVCGWVGLQVPGGTAEESRVLQGVMLNKDVTHPRMRRRIENPRVVLLDCPLEYKKGESQVEEEGEGGGGGGGREGGVIIASVHSRLLLRSVERWTSPGCWSWRRKPSRRCALR